MIRFACKWFKRCGGWLVIAALFIGLVISIRSCKSPSPEKVAHARAMTTELTTLVRGDLVHINYDWEIVSSCTTETLITVSFRDQKYVNRETSRARWIVDRVVGKSDTNSYSAVCVDLITRMVH